MHSSGAATLSCACFACLLVMSRTAAAGQWTVMVYADGERVETKEILVRD